jgi:hypothetical protein
MNKKHKLFIFDLDDTVIESDHVFWDLAYCLTGHKVEEEKRKNRTGMYLSDAELGYSVDDEDRVLLLMDTMRIWEKLRFYTGAIDLIRQIHVGCVHSVHYNTARHSNVRDQTLKCFLDQNVPVPGYNNLHMVSDESDKCENLKKIVDRYEKEYGGNLEIYYFEDHPKYLDYATTLNIDHVMTFDNNYMRKNCKNVDKVEVFKSQQECFRVVRERIWG